MRQLFSEPAGAQAHCRRGAEAREKGDWEAALHHYLAALRLDGRRADAWNDLGLVYCARGDFAHAREAYSRAIDRDARLLPALLNMANLLREEFLDFHAAERSYRQAIAVDPANAGALTGLGLSLQEQGRVEEAASCYREALQIDEHFAEAREYLLFALNLVPGLSRETTFVEHRRWAELHADPVDRMPASPRAPGQWRLGFVSGDFRGHSTASFTLPLLANLDRSRFQVLCYDASGRADATTARFRPLASQWREIHALSDEAVAETIRGDAIDALIDLSGHTRGNRLGVFARKPAPVAMTWLGYLNTTGMRAMDYRITDARADPPESDRFHTEALIRLPDTLWCYEAPADAPVPEARPDDRALVFGSCNHAAKLNGEVIALWSRVLRDLPQSRLCVMAVPDGGAGERIAAAFARHGVQADRIQMHPRCAREKYWRLLAAIDVALDAFPYNGGATTCDCLWMGTPVVTLAGESGFSRSGASILGGAGLPELIASDPAQYHSIALGLARDAGLRARLRSGLRERLRASVLMDAPRFARAFEEVVVAALRRVGIDKPC